MAQITCGYGHPYDSDLHSICPVCNQGNRSMDFTQPGVAAAQGRAVDGYNPTMGYDNMGQMGGQMGNSVGDNNVTQPPFTPAVGTSITDDLHTTPIHGIRSDVEDATTHVVGWLVCIDGVNEGKDYRLSDIPNSIGRDPSMAITIHGDTKISRLNHAVLIYEAQTNRFSLRPGLDKSTVYVNGTDAYPSKELQAYDVITIGATSLLFVPLCNAQFDWKKRKTYTEG